jgi:hypothetical protein
LALALVQGCGLWGCDDGAGKSGTPSADADGSAAPTASAAAANASAAATAVVAAAVVDPPAYAERKIEAGRGAAKVWTKAFTVARLAGHSGKTYRDAHAHCLEHGKALCSETQWARACEADPKLAELDSWTASYSGDGKFVTRGGATGGSASCDARDTAAIDEQKPGRVALCCDRAVGIASSNDNPAFVQASAKHAGDYEKAVTDGVRGVVAAQYADTIMFLGRKFERDALMREYDRDLKRFPGQWTYFDVCDMSVGKDDAGEATLIADCRAVLNRHKIYGATIRFVRGGPDHKILQVGYKKMEAANEGDGTTAGAQGDGEQKEGFGFLTPAED